MRSPRGGGPLDPGPSVTIELEAADSPVSAVLVEELEAHLEARYPSSSRHGLTVERLVAEGVDFFVVRVDGDAVGCGGILFVDDADGRYGELKRMFVRPESRGLGLGRARLERLVEQARSREISLVRLETGIHQSAAIGLYEAEGFRPIAPFGPYRDEQLTRCYELRLR